MASTNFITANTLLDRMSGSAPTGAPGGASGNVVTGVAAERSGLGRDPRDNDPGLAESTRGERTLTCMEVWGGNSAISRGVAMTGLNAWVVCEPHAGARGGGDIYYLSQCFQGFIARLVLADVSGHGEDVDELAGELRDMMRANINTPDQTKFARKLNKAFGRVATAGRFATAVLATYFVPSHRLILVNAGHPRPLYYSASRGDWTLLSSISDAADEEAGGLPLGVIYPTPYTQFAVTLAPGDVVVMYTDSLIEAANGAGEMLGEAGLLREAERLGPMNPGELARGLIDAARLWHGQGALDDDATLIAISRNDSLKPERSLSERLRAVSRLIGL